MTAETRNTIGRRTAWCRLPEKWLASAQTSSPKKLTMPTVAVAVATKSAIHAKIHSVWRG